MTNSPLTLLRRLRSGRVRILWLVLGALLLVSALPIGLYHRQVLELSQEKLVDTERVQQTELTRSLAQEVQFFESNLTQQLISERQILALTGLIDNVQDPAAEPKVTRLTGKLCGFEPQYVFVFDGSRPGRKRHQRVAGQFSRGAGSIRSESVAAGVHQHAAGDQVPQRSSGTVAQQFAGVCGGGAAEGRSG